LFVYQRGNKTPLEWHVIMIEIHWSYLIDIEKDC